MKNIPSKIVLLALTAALCMAQTSPPTLKRSEESDFGKTADGTTVKLFTLRNAKGMTVKVMTLGAIITQVSVPDRDGKFANVVNGAETLQPYLGNFQAAAVMGRVANRIGGAKFTLEGKEYTLVANNAPNTLHGGRVGFDKKVYDGKLLPPTDHGSSVLLTYVSKDGEENFPGTLTLNITYALNDDNEFSITYAATTDKTTIVNFTNHAYWNLTGTPGTNVQDHELEIEADKYTPFTGAIPTGEIAPVKGTPLDFTKPTKIGAHIGELRAAGFGNTYDHNWVLNNGGKSIALAARLHDPASGRTMEVKTDQPGIQMYTAQAPYRFVCLETQHFPDSIHHPEFPTIILKPGETFKTTTSYTFSAK